MRTYTINLHVKPDEEEPFQRIVERLRKRLNAGKFKGLQLELQVEDVIAQSFYHLIEVEQTPTSDDLIAALNTTLG
jgi:hypothetical protein